MIPGVETVHRREVWQRPERPVTGPTRDLGRVLHAVAHYPGCEHCIPFTLEAIPAWLRAIDDDWWRRTPFGYSIGYSWAVDWLGGVWELRGFDHRPAANPGRLLGGSNANPLTDPVLFITAGNQPATDLAWASARAIWAETAARAGVPDLGRPLSHSDLDPTACAGAGIRGQIIAGHGDPRPPTEGDDDMTTIRLWQHPSWANVWLVGPGGALHMSPELAESYIADGVPLIIEAHPQTLDSCLATSGLTRKDLVPR